MKTELKDLEGNLVLSIPQEVVSRLGWEAGDICGLEIDGDGLRIVRTETSKHASAMKFARRGMEKYRDVFAKLAKS